MGFMTTYMDLRELFPQVDDRLLKAAALEHPNNIEFAIDFIVTEVLPDAPSGNSDASAVGTRCFSTGGFTVPEVLQYAPPVNGDASAAGTGHFSSGVEPKESISSSENAGSQFRLEDDEDFPDLSHASTFHNVSTESVEESPTNSRMISGADHGSGLQRFDTGMTKVVSIEDIKYPWEHDQKHMQTPDSFSVVAALPLSVVDALESHVPFPEDRSTSNIENRDPSNKLDGSEYLATFDGNLLKTSSEEFLFANAIGQTSQNFNVDLLEELIDEAGKNKPILLKAVESLFHLMKEADIHEKEAESAKEEAAVAGINALHKVEELKKMLEHAKEANDMHAGEVYGEKSILATEARELQARMFHLSEERDKHLSMIEEMKKNLQVRIAVADAIKAAAEQDKFNKEVAAAKALAEQELIMEKVIAESKKLQQQAEENSKLHEFLMDRGRIVDMLQGEISLICEDVKLLKERLDKGLSASSSSFMFSKLGSDRGSIASSLNLSTSKENRTSQGDEPLQCVAAEETVEMERAPVEEGKEMGVRLAENVVDHAGAWDEQWELLKDGPDSHAELA